MVIFPSIVRNSKLKQSAEALCESPLEISWMYLFNLLIKAILGKSWLLSSQEKIKFEVSGIHFKRIYLENPRQGGMQ